MATKTLGTTAQTSLTALAMQKAGLAAADVATIQQGIKSDGLQSDGINADIGAGSIVPGAWDQSQGTLIIPYRGVLRVFPGDWVGIDSQGWPILVSANSIANAAWTHS
jgi:hypothetical protein